MTISTTTSRQSYNGNGVTTIFSVPFRFFANTDLVVQLVTVSTGASTTLTLTTHYTVTGADAEAGGSLTMVTAPAVGERLVIRRVIGATQEVDYVAGDPFPAETHERALDRLTMLAQQGEEANARTLVFPAGDTASGELPAVATRASRLLGFDSSGNLVTSAPASGSAAELAIDLAGTGGAGLVGRTGGGSVQGFIDNLAGTGGAALVGLAGGGDVQDVLDDLPSLGTGTAAAVVAANPLAKIRVPLGTTLFDEVQLNGQSLDGSGVGSVIRAATGADYAVRLGHISSPSQWAYRSIRDLVIDGNTKLSDGVEFGSAASTEVSGRWVFDCVTFTACNKGVRKPSGNIGNSYRACNFTRSNYGVYAVGQVSPAMHAGNDTYTDSEFSFNDLAGAYYNSTIDGSGGLMFGKNTIFQFNPGFAVFIKNWRSSYTPVTFDGVWFEGNHTESSVTIDGTSYTPVDVHLENVAHAVMTNGIMPSVRMINSRMHVDNCLITRDVTALEKDAASVLTVSNAHIDGGNHRMDIESVTKISRGAGNFAAAWWSPVRNVLINDTFGKIVSQPFTSAVSFGGTSTILTTVVSDGRIYGTCGQLTVPASQNVQAVSATLTAGKWAVLTVDIKHVSGTLADLSIGQVQVQNLIGNYAPLLVTGEWRTIACIAQVETSGATSMNIVTGATGTQVFRMSAMQVLEFDTEQQAISYYNSRGYVL